MSPCSTAGSASSPRSSAVSSTISSTRRHRVGSRDRRRRRGGRRDRRRHRRAFARRQTRGVLGVATGSSPILTYRRLVEAFGAGRISFGRRPRRAARRVRRSRRGSSRSATGASCTSTSSTTSTCPSITSTPPMSTPKIWRRPAAATRRCCRVGWRRRAVARHRQRWPRRLQRARFVAAIAHPHQDADRRDAGRQRPLLRHPDEVPHHVMTQGSPRSATPATSCSSRAAQRRRLRSPPRSRGRSRRVARRRSSSCIRTSRS